METENKTMEDSEKARLYKIEINAIRKKYVKEHNENFLKISLLEKQNKRLKKQLFNARSKRNKLQKFIKRYLP